MQNSHLHVVKSACFRVFFLLIDRCAQKAVGQFGDELKTRTYKADYMHGDVEQYERRRRVKMFREGKLNILVATDVASRGLHIDDIT